MNFAIFCIFLKIRFRGKVHLSLEHTQNLLKTIFPVFVSMEYGPRAFPLTVILYAPLGILNGLSIFLIYQTNCHIKKLDSFLSAISRRTSLRPAGRQFRQQQSSVTRSRSLSLDGIKLFLERVIHVSTSPAHENGAVGRQVLWPIERACSVGSGVGPLKHRVSRFREFTRRCLKKSLNQFHCCL